MRKAPYKAVLSLCVGAMGGHTKQIQRFRVRKTTIFRALGNGYPKRREKSMIGKRKTNRWLAFLLSLVLIVGSVMPVSAAPVTPTDDEPDSVITEEVSDSSTEDGEAGEPAADVPEGAQSAEEDGESGSVSRDAGGTTQKYDNVYVRIASAESRHGRFLDEPEEYLDNLDAVATGINHTKGNTFTKFVVEKALTGTEDEIWETLTEKTVTGKYNLYEFAGFRTGTEDAATSGTNIDAANKLSLEGTGDLHLWAYFTPKFDASDFELTAESTLFPGSDITASHDPFTVKVSVYDDDEDTYWHPTTGEKYSAKYFWTVTAGKNYIEDKTGNPDKNTQDFTTDGTADDTFVSTGVEASGSNGVSVTVELKASDDNGSSYRTIDPDNADLFKKSYSFTIADKFIVRATASGSGIAPLTTAQIKTLKGLSGVSEEITTTGSTVSYVIKDVGTSSGKMKNVLDDLQKLFTVTSAVYAPEYTVKYRAEKTPYNAKDEDHYGDDKELVINTSEGAVATIQAANQHLVDDQNVKLLTSVAVTAAGSKFTTSANVEKVTKISLSESDGKTVSAVVTGNSAYSFPTEDEEKAKMAWRWSFVDIEAAAGQDAVSASSMSEFADLIAVSGSNLAEGVSVVGKDATVTGNTSKIRIKPLAKGKIALQAALVDKETGFALEVGKSFIVEITDANKGILKLSASANGDALPDVKFEKENEPTEEELEGLTGIIRVGKEGTGRYSDGTTGVATYTLYTQVDVPATATGLSGKSVKWTLKDITPGATEKALSFDQNSNLETANAQYQGAALSKTLYVKQFNDLPYHIVEITAEPVTKDADFVATSAKVVVYQYYAVTIANEPATGTQHGTLKTDYQVKASGAFANPIMVPAGSTFEVLKVNEEKNIAPTGDWFEATANGEGYDFDDLLFTTKYPANAVTPDIDGTSKAVKLSEKTGVSVTEDVTLTASFARNERYVPTIDSVVSKVSTSASDPTKVTETSIPVDGQAQLLMRGALSSAYTNPEATITLTANIGGKIDHTSDTIILEELATNGATSPKDMKPANDNAKLLTITNTPLLTDNKVPASNTASWTIKQKGNDDLTEPVWVRFTLHGMQDEYRYVMIVPKYMVTVTLGNPPSTATTLGVKMQQEYTSSPYTFDVERTATTLGEISRLATKAAPQVYSWTVDGKEVAQLGDHKENSEDLYHQWMVSSNITAKRFDGENWVDVALTANDTKLDKDEDTAAAYLTGPVTLVPNFIAKQFMVSYVYANGLQYESEGKTQFVSLGTDHELINLNTESVTIDGEEVSFAEYVGYNQAPKSLMKASDGKLYAKLNGTKWDVTYTLADEDGNDSGTEFKLTGASTDDKITKDTTLYVHLSTKVKLAWAAPGTSYTHAASNGTTDGKYKIENGEVSVEYGESIPATILKADAIPANDPSASSFAGWFVGDEEFVPGKTVIDETNVDAVSGLTLTGKYNTSVALEKSKNSATGAPSVEGITVETLYGSHNNIKLYDAIAKKLDGSNYNFKLYSNYVDDNDTYLIRRMNYGEGDTYTTIANNKIYVRYIASNEVMGDPDLADTNKQGIDWVGENGKGTKPGETNSNVRTVGYTVLMTDKQEKPLTTGKIGFRVVDGSDMLNFYSDAADTDSNALHVGSDDLAEYYLSNLDTNGKATVYITAPDSASVKKLMDEYPDGIEVEARYIDNESSMTSVRKTFNVKVSSITYLTTFNTGNIGVSEDGQGGQSSAKFVPGAAYNKTTLSDETNTYAVGYTTAAPQSLAALMADIDATQAAKPIYELNLSEADKALLAFDSMALSANFVYTNAAGREITIPAGTKTADVQLHYADAVVDGDVSLVSTWKDKDIKITWEFADNLTISPRLGSNTPAVYATVQTGEDAKPVALPGTAYQTAVKGKDLVLPTASELNAEGWDVQYKVSFTKDETQGTVPSVTNDSESVGKDEDEETIYTLKAPETANDLTITINLTTDVTLMHYVDNEDRGTSFATTSLAGDEVIEDVPYGTPVQGDDWGISRVAKPKTPTTAYESRGLRLEENPEDDEVLYTPPSSYYSGSGYIESNTAAARKLSFAGYIPVTVSEDAAGNKTYAYDYEGGLWDEGWTLVKDSWNDGAVTLDHYVGGDLVTTPGLVLSQMWYAPVKLTVDYDPTPDAEYGQKNPHTYANDRLTDISDNATGGYWKNGSFTEAISGTIINEDVVSNSNTYEDEEEGWTYISEDIDRTIIREDPAENWLKDENDVPSKYGKRKGDPDKREVRIKTINEVSAAKGKQPAGTYTVNVFYGDALGALDASEILDAPVQVGHNYTFAGWTTNGDIEAEKAEDGSYTFTYNKKAVNDSTVVSGEDMKIVVDENTVIKSGTALYAVYYDEPEYATISFEGTTDNIGFTDSTKTTLKVVKGQYMTGDDYDAIFGTEDKDGILKIRNANKTFSLILKTTSGINKAGGVLGKDEARDPDNEAKNDEIYVATLDKNDWWSLEGYEKYRNPVKDVKVSGDMVFTIKEADAFYTMKFSAGTGSWSDTTINLGKNYEGSFEKIEYSAADKAFIATVSTQQNLSAADLEIISRLLKPANKNDETFFGWKYRNTGKTRYSYVRIAENTKKTWNYDLEHYEAYDEDLSKGDFEEGLELTATYRPTKIQVKFLSSNVKGGGNQTGSWISGTIKTGTDLTVAKKDDYFYADVVIEPGSLRDRINENDFEVVIKSNEYSKILSNLTGPANSGTVGNRFYNSVGGRNYYYKKNSGDVIKIKIGKTDMVDGEYVLFPVFEVPEYTVIYDFGLAGKTSIQQLIDSEEAPGYDIVWAMYPDPTANTAAKNWNKAIGITEDEFDPEKRLKAQGVAEGASIKLPSVNGTTDLKVGAWYVDEWILDEDKSGTINGEEKAWDFSKDTVTAKNADENGKIQLVAHWATDAVIDMNGVSAGPAFKTTQKTINGEKAETIKTWYNEPVKWTDADYVKTGEFKNDAWSYGGYRLTEFNYADGNGDPESVKAKDLNNAGLTLTIGEVKDQNVVLAASWQVGVTFNRNSETVLDPWRKVAPVEESGDDVVIYVEKDSAIVKTADFDLDYAHLFTGNASKDKFAGINTNPDGSGTPVTAGITTFAAPATVYVQWLGEGDELITITVGSEGTSNSVISDNVSNKILLKKSGQVTLDKVMTDVLNIAQPKNGKYTLKNMTSSIELKQDAGNIYVEVGQDITGAGSYILVSDMTIKVNYEETRAAIVFMPGVGAWASNTGLIKETDDKNVDTALGAEELKANARFYVDANITTVGRKTTREITLTTADLNYMIGSLAEKYKNNYLVSNKIMISTKGNDDGFAEVTLSEFRQGVTYDISGNKADNQGVWIKAVYDVPTVSYTPYLQKDTGDVILMESKTNPGFYELQIGEKVYFKRTIKPSKAEADVEEMTYTRGAGLTADKLSESKGVFTAKAELEKPKKQKPEDPEPTTNTLTLTSSYAAGGEVNLATGGVKEFKFIINKAASDAMDDAFDDDFPEGLVVVLNDYYGVSKLNAKGNSVPITTLDQLEFVPRDKSNYGMAGVAENLTGSYSWATTPNGGKLAKNVKLSSFKDKTETVDVDLTYTANGETIYLTKPVSFVTVSMTLEPDTKDSSGKTYLDDSRPEQTEINYDIVPTYVAPERVYKALTDRGDKQYYKNVVKAIRERYEDKAADYRNWVYTQNPVNKNVEYLNIQKVTDQSTFVVTRGAAGVTKLTEVTINAKYNSGEFAAVAKVNRTTSQNGMQVVSAYVSGTTLDGKSDPYMTASEDDKNIIDLTTSDNLEELGVVRANETLDGWNDNVISYSNVTDFMQGLVVRVKVDRLSSVVNGKSVNTSLKVTSDNTKVLAFKKGYPVAATADDENNYYDLVFAVGKTAGQAIITITNNDDAKTVRKLVVNLEDKTCAPLDARAYDANAESDSIQVKLYPLSSNVSLGNPGDEFTWTTSNRAGSMAGASAISKIEIVDGGGRGEAATLNLVLAKSALKSAMNAGSKATVNFKLAAKNATYAGSEKNIIAESSLKINFTNYKLQASASILAQPDVAYKNPVMDVKLTSDAPISKVKIITEDSKWGLTKDYVGKENGNNAGGRELGENGQDYGVYVGADVLNLGGSYAKRSIRLVHENVTEAGKDPVLTDYQDSVKLRVYFDGAEESDATSAVVELGTKPQIKAKQSRITGTMVTPKITFYPLMGAVKGTFQVKTINGYNFYQNNGETEIPYTAGKVKYYGANDPAVRLANPAKGNNPQTAFRFEDKIYVTDEQELGDGKLPEGAAQVVATGTARADYSNALIYSDDYYRTVTLAQTFSIVDTAVKKLDVSYTTGKTNAVLNTNFGEDVAVVTLKVNNGATFTAENVTVSETTKKNPAGENIESEVLDYDGQIRVAFRFKDAEKPAAVGKYTYNVTAKLGSSTITTAVKVNVVNTALDKTMTITMGTGKLDVMNRGSEIIVTPVFTGLNMKEIKDVSFVNATNNKIVDNFTVEPDGTSAASIGFKRHYDDDEFDWVEDAKELLLKYKYDMRLRFTIENADGETITITPADTIQKSKLGGITLSSTANSFSLFNWVMNGLDWASNASTGITVVSNADTNKNGNTIARVRVDSYIGSGTSKASTRLDLGVLTGAQDHKIGGLNEKYSFAVYDKTKFDVKLSENDDGED